MIYQREVDDCLKVSLCNLLDLEYEEVPDFQKLLKSPEKFNRVYHQWLTSRRLSSILIDVNYEGHNRISGVQQVNPFFKCLGILERTSLSYSHVVLLEFTDKVRVIDPSLNGSAFSIWNLKQIEIITKL